MRCLAAWTDGLFYPARVVRTDAARGVVCVVFDGFEDEGPVEVREADVVRREVDHDDAGDSDDARSRRPPQRRRRDDADGDDLPGTVRVRRGRLTAAERRERIAALQAGKPAGAVVVGTTPRSVRQRQLGELFARFGRDKGWATLGDMARHIADASTRAERNHLLDRFYGLLGDAGGR